jgi:hypothetical protein
VEALVDLPAKSAWARDDEVFPTIDDFTTYVNLNFAGATPPKGTNGIYGKTFTRVFDSWYQKKSDRALSVSNAMWRTVDITLPPDPVTNRYNLPLMKWFVMAANLLPPPHTSIPGMNSTAWATTYGPLFSAFFAKFGTAVVVQSSIGGMVQLLSSWGTPLTSMGPEALLKNAKIDFTTTTGLSGDADTINAAYAADRTLDLVCVGGDDVKCTKQAITSGSWGESTNKEPRLLEYQLVPLGEVLDSLGADMKRSIQDATDNYITAKAKRWQALSKCPVSCNKHGTCKKGGYSCKCPDFPCAKPFAGRMCSGGGTAIACPIGSVSFSVAPHPWTNHAGSGKLLLPFKPGSTQVAFTYTEAHSAHDGSGGHGSLTTNSTVPFHFSVTMTVSCIRKSDGSMYSQAHALDRTGHSSIQVGPTVKSGCSTQSWKRVAVTDDLTSQISKCCFPSLLP